MADENQDISSQNLGAQLSDSSAQMPPIQAPLVQAPMKVEQEQPPMIIEKPEALIEQNQPKEEIIKEATYEEPSKLPEPRESGTAGFQGRSGAYHHRHKALENDAVFQIEVDKIKPNPYQPRKDFSEESLKELASSIREFGIIQPLVVSKIEKETENGTAVEYQLIAGERRWRAAKLVGLERVPVIIRRVSRDQELMELAIVENIQRADLNPIETARAYARLSDEFRLTQREIAARVGKSRETIANNLRILNLPTDIQNAVAENKISESQARLLLMIDDSIQQNAFFQDLLNKNLSVRELRNRIRKTNQQPITDVQRQKIVDPEVYQFEEQLSNYFGAPVKIEKSGEQGKIIISFYSPEEIKGIIQKLKTND
ncbi:MAG: ParB/RepB/Spo0J family partition protein [Patescibacteria group bacterium]